MELHQLRYFLAVAEEGSFSRAADRARVAQPSLSQQIRKLEEELGQVLFDRLARGAMLTEAGSRLLPFATRVLHEIANAKKALEDFGEEASGVVSLGVIPTICPYIAEELLVACGKKYPKVDLRMVEDVTANLVKLTENGGVNASILSTCEKWQGVSAERWTEEKLALAVPKGSGLAKRGKVRPKHLKGEPILILSESHCLSAQVRRWCAKHKLEAVDDSPAVQISTLLARVAAGKGVALLPSLARRGAAPEGCEFVNLDGGPDREITLLKNSSVYQTRAACAVMSLAREVIEKAVIEGMEVKDS